MSILPPRPGKWYLTGPMSGMPQLNIPVFDYATKVLRMQGWDVISPAEMDSDKYRAEALQLPAGASPPTCDGTWGDILARDVKIVADQVEGLILLPHWQGSRGARLEVFVALLCQKQFAKFHWEEEAVTMLSVKFIKSEFTRALYNLPSSSLVVGKRRPPRDY